MIATHIHTLLQKGLKRLKEWKKGGPNNLGLGKGS
jgi:hypothetical protein